MSDGKYIGLDRKASTWTPTQDYSAFPAVFPNHACIPTQDAVFNDEELINHALRGEAPIVTVHPKPLQRRRWWQFWLAKPRHYVLHADPGHMGLKMGPSTEPGFWRWLFTRSTWLG